LVYCTISLPRPEIEADILATFYVLSWVFMTFIVQYFTAKYYKHSKDQAP